jgi:N-acetylmuramoyl-L-alanine amidase
MSRRRRKRPAAGPARYLAPAAFLAGVTIAVLLVNSGLNAGKSKTATTLGPVTTVATTLRTTTGKHPSAGAKRFYTVQSGDTFGTIASKVGITVAELQALNPDVSTNALQVGQKLRIK